MTKDELKNLFKTNDVITETNMSQLIDDSVNEVSTVKSFSTIGGLNFNYLHASKIYSVWISGKTAKGVTLGTYANKTRIATVGQFPELAQYQGDTMGELLSLEHKDFQTKPVCYIEYDNTGVYAYNMGTGDLTIPVGTKIHYHSTLILNV